MKKLKFYTILSLCLLMSVLGKAQDAPDFEFYDINGNQIHLYSMLDQGKVVIIDCSATWCGACWGFHEEHFLQDIHEKYGPDGTDQVRVIWYEADANTGVNDLNGLTAGSLGDWVTGVDYPIINEFPVSLEPDSDFYYPFGFPTITVISPDGENLGDLYDNWLDGSGLPAMEAIIDAAVLPVNTVEPEALSINIYPNPTQDVVFLDLTQYNGAKAIENVMVVNTLGQVIRDVNVQVGQSTRVDIEDLPTGIYTLALKAKNEVLTKKTIVKY